MTRQAFEHVPTVIVGPYSHWPRRQTLAGMQAAHRRSAVSPSAAA